MAQARLTRIDAVRDMAVAVDAFRTEAIAALENLDMEIRRTLEWIHHDRHEHWNHQVRRGWERITEARVQLQQAMTARRIDERDPACIDEKKALARAKQRLETAQEKVEAVRHCARAIDHAVDEYRGARTPLASWLDSESSKALAALRRMMDNLEDYLALQASSVGVPPDSSVGVPPASPASAGVSPLGEGGDVPVLLNNAGGTPTLRNAGETPTLRDATVNPDTSGPAETEGNIS